MTRTYPPGLAVLFASATTCVAACAAACVATCIPCRVTAQGTPPVSARSTPALSLGDAIRAAARNGTPAQLAQLRAAAAAARVRQARSALLPNISATAQDGNRSFNTASFGISFPSAPGQPPLFDPNGEVIGPVRTIDARGHLQQPWSI